MTNHLIKAILVDVIDPKTTKKQAEIRLQEMENLVNTYGGVVVIKTIQKKGVPEYETYIGTGKVSEIRSEALEKKADVLIINNILKPRQIYSLQEKLKDAKIQVWDRVDLILKIFSRHARSTEAKLQIELASIKHMGPRIYNMGIELSRQAGAVGLRAGAGESNIEMMKRHLRDQELSLQKKLKHYELIREGHRLRRRRRNFKTAALVGYTNAGKSSLLNALTNKGAYVADQLFATLDTRIGKLFIPNNSDLKVQPGQNNNETYKYTPGSEILISDTIGFIRDLPPDLIEAFKSTLAETVDADVILHVIDVSDPEIHRKINVVEKILEQLGLSDKAKIYVFNKIDLIDLSELGKKRKAEEKPGKSVLKAEKGLAEKLGWESRPKPPVSIKQLQKKYQEFSPVFVSADNKENLNTLIKLLEKYI